MAMTVSLLGVILVASLLLWRNQHLQAELRRARQRFHMLADVASLGFCVLNEAGKPQYFNLRFLQLLGITAVDVPQWLEHLDIQAREALATYWHLNRQKEISELECRVILPDELRWIWLKSEAVFDGPRFIGHAITLEDITRRKQAEQTVKESEQRFSRMFHLLPVLVTITNVADGRYVDVNGQWEPMFGFTREEAIGHSSTELGIWLDPADRQQILDTIFRDGSCSGLVLPGRRKNGAIIQCEISGTMVDLGGHRYLMLLVRDVTEERNLAQALQKSEQKLRAMFDQAFQFSGLMTPDGRLVDANNTALEFINLHREAVLGCYFWDTPWWSYSEVDQARLRDAVRRAAGGETVRFEAVHPDKNGQPFHFDVSIKPILDENGTITLLIAEGRDVSELHRTSQALRQSDARFASIFNASMSALLVTRQSDGAILDVNQAFLDLLELTRADVIGQTTISVGFWQRIEDRERVLALLDQQEGVCTGLEVHWRTRSGADLIGLLSGRRVEINGETCLIWGVTDVSEQRALAREIQKLNISLEERVVNRTAELQKANRQLTETLARLELAQDELVRADKLAALGALVAGVTHELNTPLGNSITVASTLQERTGEFASQLTTGQIKRSDLAAYLEFAESGSDLLMRNLAQARDLVTSFKQVAVDQTSSQRRQFEMADLVHEVLRTMHPTLRKAKTHVEVHSEIAEGLVLDGYPGPLGQVITNFITNALLHGFEGCDAGVLKISARQLDEQYLEFVFSDNGNGVPQDVMDKIFEPFFTTKQGRGGSGLGLHIVQGIVTRILGGELTVESSPGEGTTFRLKIPLVAPAEALCAPNAV